MVEDERWSENVNDSVEVPQRGRVGKIDLVRVPAAKLIICWRQFYLWPPSSRDLK